MVSPFPSANLATVMLINYNKLNFFEVNYQSTCFSLIGIKLDCCLDFFTVTLIDIFLIFCMNFDLFHFHLKNKKNWQILSLYSVLAYF